MRVIAGKYRGHRLVAFEAGHIRPTTDRVKESVFNKLTPHTQDARFLDLFSGTGNLAIEALSRGAREVVAVESHPKSLRILRENLNKLKITEGLLVQGQDVFAFLRKYQGEAFDVVLADPPFTQAIADQVMAAVASSAVVGPGSTVVIESGAKEPILDQYGPLRLSDRRQYGDKTVSFFTCPS